MQAQIEKLQAEVSATKKYHEEVTRALQVRTALTPMPTPGNININIK
jgi:hypothetical protein|tara:strand:- start:263 stop:403 length:141 start_codon:yes stop_codon:yes gene_type:complete